MKKQVMLERIQIKKLFDRFTYDINVKNGRNVSVLIAPNGCGKTTIFNLIDCIFSTTVYKIEKISSIPFENCYCTLSNKKTIGLEMRKANNKRKRNEKTQRYTFARGITARLYQLEREGKELYLVIKEGDDGYEDEICINKIIVDAIEHMNDDINPFDFALSGVYKEIGDGEIWDIDDIESPGHRRMISQMLYVENELARFREKHGCRLNVNYITADRLHLKSIPIRRQSYAETINHESIGNDPIARMQKDFQGLYRNTDWKYKKLVSEARDSLPQMFLSAKKEAKISFDIFKRMWKEYVNDMEKYFQLGLIESTQTIIENSKLEKAFKENGVFLDVYLKAFKNTLDPWAREYERMKLLADILNKRNRVTGKRIKYGPDGLIITVDEKELPLNCLSSGEKNDLIMFYNLIFNSKVGGLVLVDEPEISLHIEWQEEYLDCLLKICEMNKLQAIVATHSPNIINGHIELYAERGLQDER